MANYEKGKRVGGRKKGTPNKATESIKALLNAILPENKLRKQWKHHLEHKDPHIRFETFKLANHYLFGKPAQPIVGDEALPPVEINISAIPRKRERA
jgi:hypothetical protein